MNSPLEKQFLPVGGTPIIVHTLRALLASPLIGEVIVALPSARLSYMQDEILSKYSLCGVTLVAGGETRQHSVANAIAASQKKSEFVLVHDAVRPFFPRDCIERLKEALREADGAITAIPVTDTIKEAKEGTILRTIDRRPLLSVQTPQLFKREALRRAYEKAFHDGFLSTDDAGLIEYAGGAVRWVFGSSLNIKITTPEDMVVAEALLKTVAG